MLPRLGVVGNSAIMNVEPIFALVLAWAAAGPGDRAGRRWPAALLVVAHGGVAGAAAARLCAEPCLQPRICCRQQGDDAAGRA
ncbi:MAG: hypothetical protein MZW92_58085 [Comamonadaceae bacterium]|nr:hypothetical protein [Comamonadaceae bacterium]